MRNYSNRYKWHVHQEECFNFCGTVWDVQKAKRIIIARPRPMFLLNLYQIVGLVELIDVDPAKVKAADPNFPVVCVRIGKGFFPIDGYHRMTKSIDSRQWTMPAVSLTKAESLKVLD